jgi:hypothetical protein
MTSSAHNRIKAIVLGLAMAFPVAAQAQNASADAAKGTLTKALSDYASVAGATKGMNDAYAAYQWGQPYAATQAGGGAWAQIAISNGDAEKLLGIANTRCDQDASRTAQLIGAQLGAQAAASYTQSRAVLCNALDVAAQMVYRYNVYQSIKANGILLKQLHKQQRFDFPGNHRRTAQFGIDIKWYPDLQDTATNGFSVEDRLSYNSWFKWSDNAPAPLNIVKKIRELSGSDEKMFCIPVINAGVQASICINNLTASGSNVQMNTYAKFNYKSRDKTISMGTVTVPAPFGYLDQVAQMKDAAKQNLANQVKTQVAQMLNIDQQTMTALQTLATAASR